MTSDPTRRFSSRVEAYIKYRPDYPADLVRLLREKHGLSMSTVIADVGSGTGILAQNFLANGNEVFGVEPNREMREAGERLLAQHARYHSVDGTAEATALPDASVDLVTAGQAFHWFDRDRARAEFSRILRPGGQVALVWNDRLLDATPFLVAYEALLRRYGTDYAAVNNKDACGDDVIQAFFAGGELATYALPNRQLFDLEGLRGRLLSSSYAPEEGHPNHAPMMAALEAIFREHAEEGRVAFLYETRLFCGRLAR
jgi:SAM-dependent methyltransferase